MHETLKYLNDKDVRDAVRILKSKGVTDKNYRYVARWLDTYENTKINKSDGKQLEFDFTSLI